MSEGGPPLAFVIMPFDSALDTVFRDMIKLTLEEAGFRVERADDLVTSRNILDDIVARLAQADLIIADLTDLNPNVFYELGIAHALNGRVLMLTQDVSSLPFDLQSYRVLEYDTHFARFADARQRLKEHADAAFSGELPFGSPVSDFARSGQPDARQAECLVPHDADELDEGEAGLLDHMVAVYDSSEKLTAAVERIGTATKEIGEEVEVASSQLDAANSVKDPGTQARAAHAVVRQVGHRMNEYAGFLEEQNAAYEQALATFESSLEAAVMAQPPDDEESREQLREQTRTLAEQETTMSESRESIAEFAEVIHSVPRIERYSSKAMNHAYTQLQRLISNMDRTSAALSRIRRIMSRLAEGD